MTAWLKRFDACVEDSTVSGGKVAEIGAKVLWKRCASFDPSARAGMRKAEPGSVKKLTAKIGKLDFADEEMRRSAIKSVSNQRMLDCGEMYSDLMRAAGIELDVEECGDREVGQCVPVGAGFAHLACVAAMGRLGRNYETFHASAIERVAADRKCDAAGTLFKFSFRESDVIFPYRA